MQHRRCHPSAAAHRGRWAASMGCCRESEGRGASPRGGCPSASAGWSLPRSGMSQVAQTAHDWQPAGNRRCERRWQVRMKTRHAQPQRRPDLRATRTPCGDHDRAPARRRATAKRPPSQSQRLDSPRPPRRSPLAPKHCLRRQHCPPWRCRYHLHQPLRPAPSDALAPKSGGYFGFARRTPRRSGPATGSPRLGNPRCVP
mmetsp:Transcript_113725/g.223051  ORF Transcript_113725/g.223051 Transcript_113725/m.223051 type:complete len:200 (+) Transcript_113725:239-838(+)